MTTDRQVIVIGSGPSGAMTASELVRQGIPVTMLESGSHLPEGWLVRAAGRTVFRRAAWRGVDNGNLHTASGDPETQWYTNLSPGGLSNQWTGAVPRFAPEDFTEGERLHERYRWPVSYEELVPYYAQAEQYLRYTGAVNSVPQLPAGLPAYEQRLPGDWQQVARCAETQGQGLTLLPLALGSPWMVARRATAFNSYDSIIRPLLRSPHFRLITGAHALRLEWSPAARRVEAVVYHDAADGSQRRLAAAAVVVACGALCSTRLLFNSACADFPEGLGNSEGLLGSYLHDHPRDWWAVDLDRPLTRLAHAAYLTRRPYADSAPLLATGWTLGLASTREKLLSFIPSKSSAVGVQVFGTMVPSDRHFVKPSAERKDEFGLPLLDICIRYDADTRANMLAACDRLLEVLGEAGYQARLRPAEHKLVPGVSVHYGGTARMHQSRKYGVLDGYNRVYDVPNVILADASCFTTGPEKNPTLTAMALAARAADRLAQDLCAGG